ncbi:MAG: hypothetical protein LUH05_02005, partial [Candidatus Gastranaerophilales bacterium]|nr:hypothetical protein [Candidatus Gastranaerophilales bacterium]
ILNASGNYVVQFLSYLIQYILILCSVTLCIYFLLLNMFGDHVSLLVLKSILIVISFFSIFIFSSELYGDVIPEIKVKKVKSKRKIS